MEIEKIRGNGHYGDIGQEDLVKIEAELKLREENKKMELEKVSDEEIFREAKLRQLKLGDNRLTPSEAFPPIDCSRQFEKKEYPAICAACGNRTTVPFKPNTNWAVYCRSCYANKQQNKQRGDYNAR